MIHNFDNEYKNNLTTFIVKNKILINLLVAERNDY